MAEFSKGDRIVKMSGIAAGKYGTVNSVREDGTLNVTFDGERLSRFCDPERCGKVAANAKFKAGDYVEVIYGSDRGRKGTVELSREYRGDILYKIRFADGPEPLVRDGFVEHNIKKLNAANALAAMNADEWEKVYQIKGLPVKFVYRGSPYNDIKATIEGGNRDYIPVGRIIASAPISQVEAEKLASAKWRQIKKTARNANAARSRNSVVAKALNAVAQNASGLDDLIADLDSGKYDRLIWKQKVIGTGGGYPDIMNIPRFGYDEEDNVREAWKSGKYTSVLLYKGGTKRGEMPVNADTSAVRNSNWAMESALEGEIARAVGMPKDDITVGIYGNGIAVGTFKDKATLMKARDFVSRKIGAFKTFKIYQDNEGLSFEGLLAKDIETMNAVRNAKFKVGDRVKYTGRDILIYGKPGSVGTIKSVDTDWFGGYPIYEVEFPGARLTDSIGEERLTLANSRVCNAVAQNGLSPYGAVSGLLALKWYDKKENKNGGVMIVRAPFEAVKRYLEQSARNYPYKIAPYGRGWAKVTAPFEW